MNHLLLGQELSTSNLELREQFVFFCTHQNASKAFYSHFRHFYFFPCDPPLFLRGKNENVLEWPKNHFKDIKKLQIFHMLGGVNQHMENSICFVQIIFESFP